MPVKAVAAILGVEVKYAYHVLYRWKKDGCVLFLDRRGQSLSNKKFDNDLVAHLTSHAVLYRQRAMTLQERVEDVRLRYGVHLSVSSLSRFYRLHQITFTKADVHFINKTRNARRIQREQLQFV
jgi:transposase